MTDPVFVTTAWASDGNNRVKIDLMAGDEVKWKRNGTRGCYYGKVLSVTSKSARVKLLSHDGVEITPRIVNIKRGISSAHRNGRNLTIEI